MVRFGTGAVQDADGRDAAPPNPDVAGVPGRSRAVDDVAIANDEVVRLGGQHNGEGGENRYDFKNHKSTA